MIKYNSKWDNILGLSIDNGTNTLGFALTISNIRTRTLEVIHTEQLTAANHLYKIDGVLDDLYKRYEVIYRHMKYLLNKYDPSFVSIEKCFSYVNPSVYQKLTEASFMLTKATFEYRPMMDIYYIPPLSAKASVGVRSFKTKDPVRTAIATHSSISYNNVNPLTIGEHEVDAVAIAYCTTLRL